MLKQDFNSFLLPLHPGNTGTSSIIVKGTSSITSSASSTSSISSTSTASVSSVSVDSMTVSSTSFSSSTTSIFSGVGGGGVLGISGSIRSVIGISSSISAFMFTSPKSPNWRSKVFFSMATYVTKRAKTKPNCINNLL